MSILEVKQLQKAIESDLVLQDINLSLNAGEIMCLLGPSGCGKTTLLRLICGLESPDRGQILYEGRDMAGVEPHLRNFGMMFQEFALFPHKNVFENIAFGLRIQNPDRSEIDQRVVEVLTMVGLAGMEERNVNDLSGGERQRVALARSLAPHPRLLLLDEPLGSLDRVLRERLMKDLQSILKQIRITSIFVTHDHNEAFSVADRIAVFNSGRIEQIDRPERLYKNPVNRFVASFLGFQNLFYGTVQSDGRVDSPLGLTSLPDMEDESGGRVTILIRPEAARLPDANEKLAGGEVEIAGRSRVIRFQGAEYQLTLELNSGDLLVVNLPNDVEIPRPDQPVRLFLKTSAISLIGSA